MTREKFGCDVTPRRLETLVRTYAPPAVRLRAGRVVIHGSAPVLRSPHEPHKGLYFLKNPRIFLKVICLVRKVRRVRLFTVYAPSIRGGKDVRLDCPVSLIGCVVLVAGTLFDGEVVHRNGHAGFPETLTQQAADTFAPGFV